VEPEVLETVAVQIAEEFPLTGQILVKGQKVDQRVNLGDDPGEQYHPSDGAAVVGAPDQVLGVGEQGGPDDAGLLRGIGVRQELRVGDEPIQQRRVVGRGGIGPVEASSTDGHSGIRWRWP
jgi:hypothetical protein